MGLDLTKAHVLESGDILLPKCRIAYPGVGHEKKQMNEEYRFEANCLIPKDADLSALKKHMVKIGMDEFSDEKKVKKYVKDRILDAGEKFPDFDGDTLLRPKSKNKPGVLNSKRQNVPDDDADELIATAQCLVTVRPYAYNVNNSKGISLGLQNVLILAESAERIGASRISAEEQFSALDIDTGSEESDAEGDDDFDFMDE